MVKFATGLARSYLWVVFSVARVHGDRLEVERYAEVTGGHDVPAKACNDVS
jgi:hypothetical protein